MGDVPAKGMESEMGAVGAMLLEPQRVVAMARIDFRLTPDDFAMNGCALVYGVLLVMDAEPKGVIDVLTVGQRLEDQGKLESAGGREFLLACMDACPTTAHAHSYLDTVKQKALLRGVEAVARSVALEARRCERADDLLRGIPERFVSLTDEAPEREESNADALDQLYSRWETAKADREAGREPELWGLPTPWPEMNRRTLGVDTGLTILAGRPSAGKTTFEDQLSVFWAQSGIPVARVALDMGWKGRLLQRSAARLASVSLPKLKAGYASRRQLADVREAVEELKKLPMFINEYDSDIDNICSWARAMSVKHGVKVLTIDFAQLVTSSRGDGKYMNRNEEVGLITRRLKKLYGDCGVRVLLLSQLARIAERSGKERAPVLSDLRDSGNLEQDAQTVWALYKDQEAPESKKLRPVWCEILKSQDAECGPMAFWMRPNYFRFDESPDEFATVPGVDVVSSYDFSEVAEEELVFHESS